jgi:hypothetical protein
VAAAPVALAAVGAIIPGVARVIAVIPSAQVDAFGVGTMAVAGSMLVPGSMLVLPSSVMAG